MQAAGRTKRAAPKDSGPGQPIEPSRVAYYAGKFGCTPFEAAARLGVKELSKEELADYKRGKNEHAFDIMRAIYTSAVIDRNPKILIWFIENTLKREEVDTEIKDKEMTPEQRRERIRLLTKQVAI